MAFTIGRAGGDVAMREPKTTSFDGQTVTIDGDIIASSFADATALRQQLLGMLEEDSPVVPITWGADGHLDGYYTIKSISVPSNVISKARYYYPYTIVAERVGQYARPVFELMSIGALRNNSHSIVASDTFDYTWRPLSAIPVQTATTFSTGNLRTPSDASASAYFLKYNTPASQFTTAYFVQPSQFYEGACKLEVSYDSGSTWRAVVGRYVENLPTQYRISNGFVRVTDPADTVVALNVSHYDGSQWETAKKYYVTSTSTSISMGAPAVITVLRNDTEQVSVRLSYGFAGSDAPTLDVSLRRGARNVQCFWSRPESSAAYGVFRASVEAATAITGGIRATSDDAGGNRYVLSTPSAKTNDLTNGGMYLSSNATSLNFMIGMEVGGSSATNDETAQNQVYQYMAARSHTLRYVGR